MLRFAVRMVTVPLSNTLMAAPFRVLAALSLAALGCRGADAARRESTSSPAASTTPATAASARSPNATLNDSVSAHADSARIRGNRSQNVLWIVEASDFQCPYCKMWHDSTYYALPTRRVGVYVNGSGWNRAGA